MHVHTIYAIIYVLAIILMRTSVAALARNADAERVVCNVVVYSSHQLLDASCTCCGHDR